MYSPRYRLFANIEPLQIELFVKSKAGEIDRRIGIFPNGFDSPIIGAANSDVSVAQCSKTVAVLCQKDNSTTLSSKRLARYAKAEAELERYYL